MTHPALAPAPRTWTIVIPWNVQTLSPNRRLHHMERYKLGREAIRAAQYAWIAAGRPKAKPPIRLSIVVRRARGIDADNVVAACKVLIDALFTGAIVNDDGPRYLSLGGVTQEIGPQFRGAEQVVFDIQEVA